MATKYHGRTGLIYYSTAEATTGTQVGNLTEWTIDQKRDKVDVTCMGDANKAALMGLKDLSGTFSGFMSTNSAFFQAVDLSDPVRIDIIPFVSASVNSTFIFRGPCNLDLTVEGGVSKAVGFKGSFVATGDWANASSTIST